MGKRIIEGSDSLMSFALAHADDFFAPGDEHIAKGLMAYLGLHKAPQKTQIPPKQQQTLSQQKPALSEDHKNIRDFPAQGDIVHHLSSNNHYRVEGVDAKGTVSTSKRPAAGGKWATGEKWTHEQWHRAHDQGSFKVVRPSPTRQIQPQGKGPVGEPLRMKSEPIVRSQRDEQDIRFVTTKPRSGDRVFLSDNTNLTFLGERDGGYLVHKSDAPRKAVVKPALWDKWCKSFGIAVAFAPLEKSATTPVVEIVDEVVVEAAPDMASVLKSRGLREGDVFETIPPAGFSSKVTTRKILKSMPNGMVKVEEIPYADMSRQIYVHAREFVDGLDADRLRIVQLAPDVVADPIAGPMCRKCGNNPISSQLPGVGYCDSCLTVNVTR